MWKLALEFIASAALSLFVIFKAGASTWAVKNMALMRFMCLKKPHRLQLQYPRL